jgi:hypothetical protein
MIKIMSTNEFLKSMLHRIEFDKTSLSIHCIDCDYMSQSKPGTTRSGCMKTNDGIEHCDGCWVKEEAKEKPKSKRGGRVRISMDIPKVIHEQLWEMAKKHNTTLTKYMIRMMLKELQLEKDYNG